jgi:hypothetical protein
MNANRGLWIGRRTFVRAAVGAVAAVVSFSYPGLASILAPDQSRALAVAQGASDPSFWSGVVTAKGAQNLIVTSELGSRRVSVQEGATIWRELPVSIDAVSLGDSVMVRGEPQADGSLAARPGWLWVNIGRWDGLIVATVPGGVVVKREDGVHRTVHFSPALQVIRAARQDSIPGGSEALAVGMQVGSVGLRLPDRSLRATRIWVH